MQDEDLLDNGLSDTNSDDMVDNEDLDIFDMSDEEFESADDKGELEFQKKEENDDKDTSTESANNVEDNEDSSASETDKDKDLDSEGNNNNHQPNGNSSSDSGEDDEESKEDNTTKSVTDTNKDTNPEEKPRKKRHSQDRSLTPEQQEALEKNIAEQTKDLTSEDYEKAYKDLLKPLWARGHNFTPRNIEEVKTLMSQGVDYLYKTQQLAKSRKQVELLQRENISDADLTFLIDLKKGDPEAVKKFFADNKLNPYDIDTSEEVKYQPKTQMVDDATLALRDSVNNLMAKPDGRDCYNELVNTLDTESQNYFLKEPQLLDTFYQHQHTIVGNNKSLYTIIKEEIDHAKALGQLPQNMTFLDAYRTVGDNLLRVNQAVNQPSYNQVNQVRSTTAPEIHQRLGSVQNRANTNEKLRSAGVSPKTKATRSKQVIDPFDMPDDEFLKQFDGRL